MKSVMITILCAFALVAGAQSLSKRVPQGKVKTFDEWSHRRSEIAHEIQHYGIGTKPAVPDGGGAAAWRASRESTKAGKNLEDIDKTDYHWFLESQFPEVQAFIDKFLLGKNTDTKNIEKSDLN